MKGRPRFKKRTALRAPAPEPDYALVAAEIAAFLKRRGASGFVVGGLLRDFLAGIPSRDMDLVVDRVNPRDLASHLHKRFGFSTPACFARFDTVLTVRDGLSIEISRLEGDMALDAICRDFTVNCLYADLAALGGGLNRKLILDPTGYGFRDLRQGVLRSPSDPLITFWLDPLRILRAIRFRATRGFKLEAGLLAAIPRLVYLLSGVASERVRDEIVRIVTSGRVTSSFMLMQKTGILGIVLPELDRTAGLSQGTPYHSFDLFTHTIKTAANLRADLNLRMAALLHDLGKLETRTQRDGRSVYYGHDQASARIAGEILRRLRFPAKAAREIIFLVEHHMVNYSTRWSDRAVRRLMRKLGGRLDDVLDLVEADRKAQHSDPSLAGNIRELRHRTREIERVIGRGPVLPVTGHDIMSMLGIKQGPQVGRAKEYLLDEALKRRGRLTREECRALLGRWRERKPGTA